MTAQTTTSMDKAWEKAIAQAESMTLPDYLWERPQVQGFTIDGPASRDLDDAIWIEMTKEGAIVSVHIADVSEMVQVGSAIDKVALARTQTSYFGWGNDPMIPHALSENLLSLWSGRKRPTLTVKITLNENAEIVETEIFESWLKSKKKLSYEEADAIAQDPDASFHHMFKHYQSWAEKLSQQREARGAFGGLLSKTGVLFNEDGNVVTQDKFFHSQIIIQEFMILANRAVAQWFADHDILALYRNHTARAIAPERDELMNTLLTLGNTELIRQRLQNWLNRATYDPTLIGHFALNLPAYCHFTSPIRRLPDLINHRIIKAKLHGKRHPYKRFELEQLCQYIQTVAIQQEEAIAAFHKERTQRQFSRQLLNPEALDKLPEKEFTNVLKHSLRDENFTAIRGTAIARLNAGKLVVQDLFLLLVQSGDKDIQQAVLEHLKGKPENAPSIIAMGLSQEPTWDDFDYIAEGDKAPFTFWAQVIVAGLPFTTKRPAQENKKQRSRHLACLAWLEAFVNGELVAPEQREKPKPPEPVVQPKSKQQKAVQTQPKKSKTEKILGQKLSDSGNMVGLLLQFCQLGQFPEPIYELTEGEDGFTCRCQITAWEREFVGEAIAKKKQHSRRLAAKAVLEQVQAHLRG